MVALTVARAYALAAVLAVSDLLRPAVGWAPSVVEFLGFAAIFLGVWWMHPPSAMIAAGVGALLWARGAGTRGA